MVERSFTSKVVVGSIPIAIQIQMKFKIEKFVKPHKKTPVAESHLYSSCSLKSFPKFTRKQLCRSLVLKEASGCKISQIPQINICAGVSFLIKLQTGGTTSTPNYWCIHLSLFRRLHVIFLHHLHSVLSLTTRNCGNCCHSASNISHVKSCGYHLQKKPQNQMWQGSLLKDVKLNRFFSLNLELEQAPFLLKIFFIFPFTPQRIHYPLLSL